MNKQEYNQLLQNNICTVVFTKKNGEERVMKCTLKPEIIEEVNSPKHTSRTVNVPESQVRCIDIEKKEWRSFNIDSVISFTTSNE